PGLGIFFLGSRNHWPLSAFRPLVGPGHKGGEAAVARAVRSSGLRFPAESPEFSSSSVVSEACLPRPGTLLSVGGAYGGQDGEPDRQRQADKPRPRRHSPKLP